MSSAASVCVVFPAHNEEACLATVVTAAQFFLSARRAEYAIVVVDDGSSDRTAEVAERLRLQNPTNLTVISHEINRGYGAAVRSGLAAALATGCRWVFLTDADGQFNIRELAVLLDIATDLGVEIVTGRRIERADPPIRRLNAWLWSTTCRLLFQLPVHDVDCAFKLIDRRVLETIQLEGDAAVISPELLAKAARAGYQIVEVPVSHYPRHAGEQSGANLRVIARSLVGLLRLRRSLTARQPGSLAAQRRPPLPR